LLREIVPGVSRIGLLYDPLGSVWVAQMQPAATALGLELQLLQAELPDQLVPAFRAMQEQRAQALYVPTTPFLYRNGPTIAKLSVDYQLPSLFIDRHFTESGGLMSYGTSLTPMYRRAGVFVGKILKGTKPADLPVEQPTKFEFVINLGTARALGLTIPQTFLQQATEVIQ
jgi:putative ABC transport system substrate-binding protein